MKVDLYTNAGEIKGDLTLNDEVFGQEVNHKLIHQFLVMQQANRRVAIAHVKNRSAVSGGGRKPHSQKGTGRARLGSTRAPHCIGGGVVFGPNSNRNFSKMMPKKQRRKALFSALSSKANSKGIMVLAKTIESGKTKEFTSLLSKLPVERNLLVVVCDKSDNLCLSSKNLQNIKTIMVNYLNIEDLLKYKKVLFLEESLTKLESIFLNK
jgi:large subunit ribosomal protein L4